jgi:hypothetical protein
MSDEMSLDNEDWIHNVAAQEAFLNLSLEGKQRLVQVLIGQMKNGLQDQKNRPVTPPSLSIKRALQSPETPHKGEARKVLY